MVACGILDISSYAPLIVTDFGATHRKVRKERKAQPQFRTRMTRIGRISTDTANLRTGSTEYAFNPVHPVILSNFNGWFPALKRARICGRE
jgi:hypothetical protein